jgi:hypothetical protein
LAHLATMAELVPSLTLTTDRPVFPGLVAGNFAPPRPSIGENRNEGPCGPSNDASNPVGPGRIHSGSHLDPGDLHADGGSTSAALDGIVLASRPAKMPSFSSPRPPCPLASRRRSCVGWQSPNCGVVACFAQAWWRADMLTPPPTSPMSTPLGRRYRQLPGQAVRGGSGR